MPLQHIPIPFPGNGVNKNWAFGAQPPGSSRDMQNMRLMDPKTRRLRGAQRPGMTQFISSQINGSNKVQHLTHITYSQKNVDWTRQDDPANTPKLAQATPNRLNQEADQPHVIRLDSQGNVVVQFGPNAVQVLSADLVEIQTFYVPIVDRQTRVNTMVLDDLDNVYLGTSESDPAVTSQAQMLYKYEKRSKPSGAGFEYKLAWETEIPVLTTSIRGLTKALFWSREEDRLYGFCARVDATNGAFLCIWSNLNLPSPTLFNDGAGTQPELQTQAGSQLNELRDILVRDDGSIWCATTWANNAGFGATKPSWVGLYRFVDDNSASVIPADQDVLFSDVVQADTLQITGGFGLALDRLDKTVVYTVGPIVNNSGGGWVNWGVSALREATSGNRLDGVQYTKSDVNPHTILGSAANELTGESVQMVVDIHNNLYVPMPRDAQGDQDTNPATPPDLGAWTVLVLHPRADGVFADDEVLLEYLEDDTSINNSRGAIGVAVREFEPGYEEDLTSGVTSPQRDVAEVFYYIAHPTDAHGFGATPTFDDTVIKVRQVTSAPNGDPPRATNYLAVSEGLVKVLDPDGDTVNNPATNPGTTAGDQLDGSAQYVDSTILLSRVYFTDGETYMRYDPRDDTLEALTASMGELPGRCRLITAWRDRLVLARADGEDGPHNWFMSRAGDPLDWDEAPAQEDAGQAISGNNPAGAGLVPDIINSLIPYNDDLLFFLCDHSIHRLTGDPLFGGQIDLVTDKVGGLFGRPWTKDREGRVLFMDSEGGMAELTGTGVARLSRDTIEEDLRDIDFSTNYVQLEWDNDSEGVHIYVLPFGADGSADTQHWFWDQRTAAFFPQTFSTPPSAVATFDGDDPDDRRVVMGFNATVGNASGMTLYWDDDAETDDGDNIDSHVLFGPIIPSSESMEHRFMHTIAELARDQGPARYELYISDEPDVDLAVPYRDGDLLPGRNRAIKERARGSYFWIRLRNSGATRWAFESLSTQAAPAGRKRVRS